MPTLRDALCRVVPRFREDRERMVRECGETVLGKVTLAAACEGMKGVPAFVCDLSEVDPGAGLSIRGRTIAGLCDRLPEEVFWLMCTGEFPGPEAAAGLAATFEARHEVPGYVWRTLDAMPADSHPATMLAAAVLVLSRESRLVRQYDEGMPREACWEPMLDDALDLLARLPAIAAGVYRKRYNKGPRVRPKPGLSWAGNYARMLGIPDAGGEFADLVRLYLVLHADHGAGNVSAHTARIVSSALSDVCTTVSAAVNGMAGPLHGRGCRESLAFLQEAWKRFRRVPTEEEAREFVREKLRAGREIPGYGHAVLRVPDPRLSVLREFGHRRIPDDPLLRVAEAFFAVVPDILREDGRTPHGWPRSDAFAGALLYRCGLKEVSYYPVLFAVARTLGICARIVLDQALGVPVERPLSVTSRTVRGLSSRGAVKRAS